MNVFAGVLVDSVCILKSTAVTALAQFDPRCAIHAAGCRHRALPRRHDDSSGVGVRDCAASAAITVACQHDSIPQLGTAALHFEDGWLAVGRGRADAGSSVTAVCADWLQAVLTIDASSSVDPADAVYQALYRTSPSSAPALTFTWSCRWYNGSADGSLGGGVSSATALDALGASIATGTYSNDRCQRYDSSGNLVDALPPSSMHSSALSYGSYSLPPGLYLFQLTVSRAAPDLVTTLGIPSLAAAGVVTNEVTTRTAVTAVYALITGAATPVVSVDVRTVTNAQGTVQRWVLQASVATTTPMHYSWLLPVGVALTTPTDTQVLVVPASAFASAGTYTFRVLARQLNDVTSPVGAADVQVCCQRCPVTVDVFAT